MSRKLQNVFVVCAMIIAFAAWAMVVIFRIMPCAKLVKEAGYKEAYCIIWLLTQVVSCVVGWVIGNDGGKLLAQINGRSKED